MFDCKDCTVTYKAKDGVEFKTLEECKAWNRRPRVYFLINSSSYGSTVLQAFVSKEVAQNNADALNEKRHRLSTSMYGVSEVIINLNEKVKTVQEHITNEKPDEKSWYKKIFNV